MTDADAAADADTDAAADGDADADAAADAAADADAAGDADADADAATPPTIYEWMGGAEALHRLTETFYEHVHADAVLASVFAAMDTGHPQHVAVWLAEVFGGPADYSSHHGGHAHMASRHLGRGITEQQRQRWVQLLMATADEVGLPADPEFRAVFAYYVEWGTRMALLYSGPNPPPVVEAPVPRWGWNQTPPWTG